MRLAEGRGLTFAPGSFADCVDMAKEQRIVVLVLYLRERDLRVDEVKRQDRDMNQWEANQGQPWTST